MRELSLETLIAEAQECDGTGTIRLLNRKCNEQEFTDDNGMLACNMEFPLISIVKELKCFFLK